MTGTVPHLQESGGLADSEVKASRTGSNSNLPGCGLIFYLLLPASLTITRGVRFSETTPRSICCGPGENQWDLTFSKKISLSEARYFQFRADIFNVFNKTQFVNPDGNFSNSTFGQILQARDPRLVQFALKFYF